MSKKLLQRGAALMLAGAMICGSALGTAADGNVPAEKQETVYATLASDGTVQKVTDSVWLHADAGLKGYVDETGLSDVTMLKGTQAPEQNGSRLTFSTEDTDAWYQGSTSAELPVCAKITWTLDGKEMTAEQMAGQSGHLVMHIAFTNNSYQMQTIGGQSRRIYTPIMTIAAVTLDTDVFQNVKADDAITQSDSAKDLMAFVCLPGLSQTYDGLLTGELATLNDYLHDDVTMEADVTNFEMPMLYIAASTDASAFSKDTELADYSELFDSMDQLTDAMNQLLDGGKQLLDGTGTLNTGAGDLYNGIKTLDDGAGTLQNGAHALSDGAAKAANGSAQLYAGVSTLSGKSAALRAGMAQVKDAVLDTANSQLAAYGVTLSWDNYASVLQSIIDSQCAGVSYSAEDYANAQAGVLAQLKNDYQLDDASAQAVYNVACAYLANGTSTVYTDALTQAGALCTTIATAKGELAAAPTAPWTIDSVKAVCIGVLYQNQQAFHMAIPDLATAAQYWNASEQLQQATWQAYTGNIAQNTGISDANTVALLAVYGADLYCAGGYEIVDQAVAQAGANLTMANTAPAADNALLTQVLQATMCKTLYDLKTSLAGVEELAGGLNAYTGAVDGDVLKNLGELKSGLSDLNDGVGKLVGGADNLKGGADKLLDGASTLKTGTGTLKDGVQELYDGLNRLNDEGISKLTENDDIGDLQTLMDVTDAVKTQAESYTGFACEDDDVKGSVKFILRVTAEKTDSTVSQSADANADANGNFFASLWQRFLALFRG